MTKQCTKWRDRLRDQMTARTWSSIYKAAHKRGEHHKPVKDCPICKAIAKAESKC